MAAQQLANILVAVGYAIILAVAVACAIYRVRLRRSDSPELDGRPTDKEDSE